MSELIVHSRSESSGGFVKGTVRTPHGYVRVHSQGLQYITATPLEKADGALLSTTLSIIVNGKELERVIEDAFSDIRLATLARDFAREAAREAERAAVKDTPPL